MALEKAGSRKRTGLLAVIIMYIYLPTNTLLLSWVQPLISSHGFPAAKAFLSRD